MLKISGRVDTSLGLTAGQYRSRQQPSDPLAHFLALLQIHKTANDTVTLSYIGHESFVKMKRENNVSEGMLREEGTRQEVVKSRHISHKAQSQADMKR